MSQYPITDPASGKTLEFDGPAPPPESVIRHAFAQMAQSEPAESSVPPQNLSTFASNAWKNIDPVAAARGVASMVAHPIDTAEGIYAAMEDQGLKADKAFAAGRPVEGVLRTAAQVPVIGPLAAGIVEQGASGDLVGAAGQIAGLMVGPGLVKGALRGAGAGARAVGRVPAAVRGAMTATPEIADATRWALDQGIPVDVATASQNRVVRGLKQGADSTLGGAVPGARASAARSEALEATARKLAGKAHPAAQTPETAGASVTGSLEGTIRSEAEKQAAHYGAVKAAERAAMPDDVPISRPVAGGRTVDQGFIGHWLADDLSEQGFQKGGSTQAARDLAEELRGIDDEAAHRLKFVGGAAGTRVLEMFHEAGVSGSAPAVADKIRRVLTGESNNPRVLGLIDAMREAWDGQRFDFDLITDESLARTGLKRRQFANPLGIPNLDTPGSSQFFGAEAGGRAASGTEPMQMAVDLRAAKEALRGIHAELSHEASLVPFISGSGKGRALVQLDRLLKGPDHAPLSTVDAALGELKAVARGADMPELRTPGQGIAAEAVKQLETLVQERAKVAGVWDDLRAGRDATIAKYTARDVLDVLKAEPVGTFKALIANEDAGLARLREVAKLAPQEMPKIGRAYLDDVIEKSVGGSGKFGREARTFAEWRKLGPETKKIIFPDPALRAELDKFFLVAERMAENVNPSGSALTGSVLAQVGGFATGVVVAPLAALGALAASTGAGYGASRLLNSPAVVRLLTQAAQTPATAPAAAGLAARLKAAVRAGARAVPAKGAIYRAGAVQGSQSTPGSQP